MRAKIILSLFFLLTVNNKVSAEWTGNAWQNHLLMGGMIAANSYSIGLESGYNFQEQCYVQGFDISRSIFCIKGSINLQGFATQKINPPFDFRLLVGPSIDVLQFQIGYAMCQRNLVLRTQSAWSWDPHWKSFPWLSVSVFYEWCYPSNFHQVGISVQYLKIFE